MLLPSCAYPSNLSSRSLQKKKLHKLQLAWLERNGTFVRIKSGSKAARTIKSQPFSLSTSETDAREFGAEANN